MIGARYPEEGLGAALHQHPAAQQEIWGYAIGYPTRFFPCVSTTAPPRALQSQAGEHPPEAAG